MSNLKKVFALSLVLVMCFSLISTGLAEAGTDYTTYTDVGDINYVDAVSLLSALDILKGMPSGAFDPKGDVQRAQLCKMIYVVLNNGIDDGAALYRSDGSVPLTDIAGHWAEGYINYCYKRGIVAGVGDGTFRPDENVTGIQAFKMILVSLGYDPIKEGYVGSGWQGNIGMDAQEAALTDRIESVDILGFISREISSQIIYNGLFSTMVHYPNGVLTKRLGSDSFTPLTFAWDKLGLRILDGVLVANDQVSVRETDAGGVTHGIAEAGHSTIKYKAYRDAGNTVAGGAISSDYVDAYVSIKTKTPYTLVGKAVNAYVKVKPGIRASSYNWVSGIDKVYGNVVENPGMNIVVRATNDDYPTDNLNANTKFFINYWDGTDLAAGRVAPFTTISAASTLRERRAAFDEYYTSSARVDDPAAAKGQTVWLISNTGSKSVDYVLGFDKRFGEITTYTGDKLTVTKNDHANYKQSYYSINFSDIFNVGDFKLNDRALMWKIFDNNTYYLESPEVITGTLTGSTSTGSEPVAIINGTNHKIARDHIAYSDVIATQFVNKEIGYYLDNGYIVGVDEKGVTRLPDKYLVVRDSTVEAPKLTTDRNRYLASVLTSDGSKKTLEISAIYDRAGAKIPDATLDAANTADTAVKYPLSGFASPISINEQVFRYTLTSDNKLALYAPDAIGLTLNREFTKGSASVSLKGTNNAVFSKFMDNQTVAFIKNRPVTGTADWYTFTGYSNIPGMSAVNENNNISAAYGKFSTTNDLLKAIAVPVSGWTGTSAGANFGLVISSLATINTDNTWYYKELTMFNGTDVVTYTVKNEVRVGSDMFGEGSLVNAGNGRIVRYTFSGNVIDTIEFVDLTETPEISRFQAGYIYRSTGRSFTIADYLPASGVPVGSSIYTLKDNAKIFFYDGTAAGSGVITEIPAQNVPAFNYDDRGRFTYQAVAELDDTAGIAKTLYIFKDEQKLEVARPADEVFNRLAVKEVVETQPITIGMAGTFRVRLSTLDTLSGNRIVWSAPTVSGLTGVTLAAGTNPVTANDAATFTFDVSASAPAARGSVAFTGRLTNANGATIAINTVTLPVALGTDAEMIASSLAKISATKSVNLTVADILGKNVDLDFPMSDADDEVTFTYAVSGTAAIIAEKVTPSVVNSGTDADKIVRLTGAGDAAPFASPADFTVTVTGAKGAATATKDVTVTVNVAA
ncbi:hypothetical protein FACS1894171_1770 [Clostridia bacterium]|nr:hypothetical protein FACS1894171_1770 [Clostridia bacterium]